MGRDRLDLLRLQREYSWEKEEWFVPLGAALEGVGPAEAAWQPPGGGNTIWQTVAHLNYYNERMLNRLTGAPVGPGSSNIATFGEPGLSANAAEWKATVAQTHRIADALRTALASRPDADLDQLGVSAPLGEELALWVMHDAYHTGQIVLIRKQQGSWPAQRG